MAASRNRPPDLFDRVAAFVATHVPAGADLCVGLSGGCDSVVLLHLLSRAGLGPRLSALHVHHGLSPDADAWVAHCQALCDRLAIPLTVCRVQVRPEGEGLEAAARAARYAAFASHPARFVALGHHRDDQAETVLFNLLRGSGLAGLAGMPPVRQAGGQTCLRPLLDVPRADLETYARAEGLAWVTDSSNADPRFARNFLRHDILPRLSGHFPGAGSSLARAAGHVAEAVGLLADLAEMDWAACQGDAHSIALAPARQLGARRLKHLVRHGLRLHGWRAPVSERLEEFVRQVMTAAPDRHPALDLAEGRLRVAGRRLHWEAGTAQSVTSTLSGGETHQLQSPDYSSLRHAMITGSIVAIVTPMHEDGSLDLGSLRKLVDFHVNEGTDAIVVVGTTGESPTVSVDEHCELIRVVVEHAAGRIPVIAGTGGNSTAEAIELTEFAKKAGADMSLSVVPYYNKPTQEGMVRHFKAIAEAVELPILLYNVPGRTVADMSNDTILRLAEVPGIVGVKDATGNLDRACDLIARAPKDFALYSGDDMTCVASIMLGFHGNISVTANVAPRLMHEMCVAAAAGNVARAREIHFQLLGLHRDLFCEANPIPVKWAVQQMGLMPGGIRLPLTPLSEAGQAKVLAALRQAGIVN